MNQDKARQEKAEYRQRQEQMQYPSRLFAQYLMSPVITPDGEAKLMSIGTMLFPGRIGVHFGRSVKTVNSIDEHSGKVRNYGDYNIKSQILVPFSASGDSSDTIYVPGGCQLSLKNLATVSDEDAKTVAEIMSFHDGDGMIVFHQKDRVSIYDRYEDEPHKRNVLHIFTESFEIFSLDENGKVFQYDFERLLHAADYLRSKSFALPFLGKSVAEQIQENLIIIR